MDSGIQKLGPRQQALIDALRSGKYEQCFGRLRRGGKFCCLGVACDLVPGLKWTDDEIAVFQGKSTIGILPEAVVEYYGFCSIFGCGLNSVFEHTSLTLMNDIGEMPFNKIADAIEEEPANFFKESK